MKTKAAFATTVLLTVLTLLPFGLATAPAARANTGDTLAFTTPPNASYKVGDPISVTVQLQPGMAPAGDMISLVLNGPGTLNGYGGAQATDATGSTTFSGLSVSQAGSSDTLTATDGTDPTVTSGTSKSFEVLGSVSSIVLSPTSPSITSGGSQAFAAEGFDSANNDLGDVTGSVTFSISPDGSCGPGSGPGNKTCTATIKGLHPVTGTYSLGITDQASLQVNPGPVASITLSPPSATITAGTGQAYTAEGFDSANNDVGDVTNNTNFTVAPLGGGSSQTCPSHVCGPTVAGDYTVTGNDGGAMNTASLTVNHAAGDHLGLNPPTTTVGPGEAVAYSATELDHFDNVVNPDVTSSTTFGISSGTCSGASCSSSTVGSNTVTGTLNSTTIKGTATLTVMTGPVNHLVFQQQPTAVPFKTTITPPVTVAVENISNVVVGSASGTITLSVVGGKATLRGTVTEPISGGVASFPSLHINTPGRNYQLEAVSAGRTSVASSLFNIQGPASLSVAASATIVGYLRHVTVTAHLAHWFTNRAVSIWFRRYPGGTPRLVGTGNVGRRGHFTATTPRLSAQIHVWATYAGDTRYLPTTSSPQNVRVRVAIGASMAGGYATSRFGYRLYHYNSSCPSRHVRCPVVTGTVLPNLAGEKIVFLVEARVAGVWKGDGVFPARLGTGSSVSEILFYASRAVEFVPLRVRAEFNGDATHAGNVSSWRYFEVTR